MVKKMIKGQTIIYKTFTHKNRNRATQEFITLLRKG